MFAGMDAGAEPNVNLQLTKLQRGVIQRLREADFVALADMANYEWSRGKQIPVADSMAIGEPHGELRADFIRANKQAAAPIAH
jgi:hypothetical protein